MTAPVRAAAFTVAIAAVLLLAARPALLGQAAAGTLRYGVSMTAIPDVNPIDGLAASVFLARAIASSAGAWSDADAALYRDSDSIVRAVNADQTDIIVLSSLEHLSIERQVKADPYVIYEKSGQVFVEYVLVAREGIESLADLQGRRVSVFSPSVQRDLGDSWFEVLLGEAGLSSAANPPQVRLSKKPTQSTMAVFFGQADAAVEPKSAFDTAVEMNPQIGRKLKVIASSGLLLPGLVCVRRTMRADIRQRALEVAVKMHERTQNRQTFLVLHVSRLVAFGPRDLVGTRQLNERYLALKKRGHLPAYE